MMSQYSFSQGRTLASRHRFSTALAIDTGSPLISVAVLVDGRLRSQRSTSERNASGTVLTMVRAILAQADLTVRDLSLLLGVRGPGSFTGLRVGMATLLGMQMALEIPTATWDTFEVLASLSPDDERDILSCVNALQDHWNTQRFSAGPSRYRVGEPRLYSTAQLRALEALHLVGFGISDLRTPETPMESCTLIEPGPLAPQALRLLSVQDPDFDARLLSRPLYLRPPAATPTRRSSNH